MYRGDTGEELDSLSVFDGINTRTPVRAISQVMALDTKGNVLLRTPSNKTSYLAVNLESGKTTDQVAVSWTPQRGKELTLQSITPQQRFAQYKEGSSVVELFGIGGDDRSVLFGGMYDQRASETPHQMKIASGSAHQFSSIEFTCAATTAKGFMVTGDTKGKVRLYEDVKKAVAVLDSNAVGDPVLGVDVTADGCYISWTTATHVYVVHYPEGASSWGARGSVKPTPVSLVARNADRILALDPEASFLPAKFDLETVDEHGMCKHIYAFLGNWCITWRMREVSQALDRLQKRVNEAKEGENVAQIEVQSSEEKNARAEVEDHLPNLRALGSVASLHQGIERMWL